MRVLNDNNQWVGDGQVIDAEPRVWDRRYGPHPSEKEWREIQRRSNEFVEFVIKDLERRMNQMVRAKFQVSKVAKTSYGQIEVTLTPQYDQSIEEDKRFSKATPSGTIQLLIDNPPASDYLALGKFFYVDFTEVPPLTASAGS